MINLWLVSTFYKCCSCIGQSAVPCVAVRIQLWRIRLFSGQLYQQWKVRWIVSVYYVCPCIGWSGSRIGRRLCWSDPAVVPCCNPRRCNWVSRKFGWQEYGGYRTSQNSRHWRTWVRNELLANVDQSLWGSELIMILPNRVIECGRSEANTPRNDLTFRRVHSTCTVSNRSRSRQFANYLYD